MTSPLIDRDVTTTNSGTNFGVTILGAVLARGMMNTHAGFTVVLICAIAAVASGPVTVSPTQQQLNGIHKDDSAKPWMNDMRHEGVKRALVWIAIDFDRQGKPKRMSVHRTEYFTTYEDDSKVSDAKRLMAIRATGLEQKLNSVALEKAARGFWTDMPHPKPRPFVGGAKLEFFDDEKLPTPEAPLYCAGKSCLPHL